ncbi:hypothetical protein [Halomonas chromatireducens]|uniref:Tc toxin complex TcA C-terminal TcB-binding domain-containing protein n=1 Tax=Halomonas chromatireducens TaxID=507626 RepID=A0A0X8HC34_9GAMM|nr:hypothetical protein [Halomonas chromatireducens]AMC99897.1 hypothetical protein LOKO_00816 [Halomonas chromatireducens]
MFNEQAYLRELLAFARLRARDSDGEAITEQELEAAFLQPFARLAMDDERSAAEQPVSQVRLAVEVLRRLVDEEEPAEAEYRELAIDSLLAQWGVSHAELLSAGEARRQDDADAGAAEIVDSLAERLGIAPERVNELLTAGEKPTEERLEQLFGLPSTKRDPLDPLDAEPSLLNWQRERLPELDEGPSENREGRGPSLRDQAEQALEQTLQAAVASAETSALPSLRDILVAAIIARHASGEGGEPNQSDAINGLTRHLALDLGNGGQVRTTRLGQATETLQTVIFGLRAGWFAQRQRLPVIPDPHPAAGWRIAFGSEYEPADFDEDWHWLGTYPMWRSAFQTLVYTDAALFPSLLLESAPHHQPSRAFRSLIEQLRTISQLTPRQARQLANGKPGRGEVPGYLAMLREEVGNDLPEGEDFVITEQLDEKALRQRRSAIREHFHAEGLVAGEQLSWLQRAPDWLKEVYYFVPLTLALHLQRSGHFSAALAWYRTIYAHEWEVGERKVFFGLVVEESLGVRLSRPPETWLREELNPHDHASMSLRKNIYTRFTLQSIIGCCLEYADAEFSAARSSSVARARSLYLTALDLLQLPEMLPPEDDRATSNPVVDGRLLPENPAIAVLRQHAELNLEKLRSGRNIAGLEQPGWRERGAGSVAAPLQRTVASRPTIYRYQVLIERARQLVGIAQQIEAAFLSSAERADAEAYNFLQARQDLALSEEQVELQELRVDEAGMGIELARLQRERAREQRDGYKAMIGVGLMSYEREMINAYQGAADARKRAMMAAFWANAVSSAASAIGGGVAGIATSMAGTAVSQYVTQREKEALEATTAAQIASVNAGFERRKQEWRRQQGLAEKDLAIGGKQVALAFLQHRMAIQERGIANLRTEHAAVTLDFLANKFTNAELYEWMSGVLNRVYRFFLQQATATALLAQNQLAFERQEKLPGFVQQDYWRPPAEGEASATGGDGAPDRRGLTGSARLLQDIYKLDQFAFKTRERRLELSQTFSLARLFPFEFEQFRRTGRLAFVTPMELFDRGFPGHYLRLIKRVSVSVVALVPPAEGIRAVLAGSGVSRVVVGPEVFRTVELQRSPELIAFTSSMNATGLFALESDSELLLPFEGQGVDTTWQLEMPRPANAFDYRTIADVLFTMDYTAQHSASYRRQVIGYFDRNLQAERPFHFRQEFADQWYELHNPGRTKAPMTVRVRTRRSDFPPNVDDLHIEHLLLCFAGVDAAELELPFIQALRFTGEDGITVDGGGAQPIDGIVSTRRGSWNALRGQPPLGEWELVLPDTEEMRELFESERIEDILFVIGYSGTASEWPV